MVVFGGRHRRTVVVIDGIEEGWLLLRNGVPRNLPNNQGTSPVVSGVVALTPRAVAKQRRQQGDSPPDMPQPRPPLLDPE